jgi:hypothetical protein
MDVTVDHVAGLEESELLKIDYGTALEKFSRVSRLKKALEQRPPIRRKARPALTPTQGSRGPAKLPSGPTQRPALDVAAMRSAVTPAQISNEETKLLRVEESIRVFVRVADPKFRQIVPMRFFNLVLTPEEVEAYCADYLEEKSLRAGVARILLRLVAVVARITTELEELKRSENSLSLWQLHADSLVALLEFTRALDENATRVLALAHQHGAAAEAEAIQASMEKLGGCTERVLATLTAAGQQRSMVTGAD